MSDRMTPDHITLKRAAELYPASVRNMRGTAAQITRFISSMSEDRAVAFSSSPATWWIGFTGKVRRRSANGARQMSGHPTL